jgi:general secretion pathway protein I
MTGRLQFGPLSLWERFRVRAVVGKTAVVADQPSPPAPLPKREGRFLRRPARGISLLEVILALAILAGAVAVLGEVARLTMRNAQAVRDSSRAQLLCESKMAEICAALAPLTPVDMAPLAQTDDPVQPEWFYSVAVDPIDQDGMKAVRVTVTHGRSPVGRPLKVSLVRWILDPRAAPTASRSTTTTEQKP